MPKLQILSGVLEGKAFDLIEERLTVGRSGDNTIRIDDGTVSHHHAILAVEGAEFKLRDLNSTNGTRVNGLRIVEAKLHHGDQVRFGSVETRFESDIKPASQPLPTSRVGVDLNEVGKGSTPPPTFSSVSPFGRKKKRAMNPWIWIVAGLTLAAVVLLARFLIVVMGMK